MTKFATIYYVVILQLYASDMEAPLRVAQSRTLFQSLTTVTKPVVTQATNVHSPVLYVRAKPILCLKGFAVNKFIEMTDKYYTTRATRWYE